MWVWEHVLCPYRPISLVCSEGPLSEGNTFLSEKAKTEGSLREGATVLQGEADGGGGDGVLGAPLCCTERDVLGSFCLSDTGLEDTVKQTASPPHPLHRCWGAGQGKPADITEVGTVQTLGSLALNSWPQAASLTPRANGVSQLPCCTPQASGVSHPLLHIRRPPSSLLLFKLPVTPTTSSAAVCDPS